jgi:hypothetical protein
MATSPLARGSSAFAIYMLGVVLFVAGLYNALGPVWFAPLILGGVVLLGSGATALAWQLRPYQWATVHPLVLWLAAATLALHAYECLHAASRPSLGFLLWSLVPSAACMLLGSMRRLRTLMVAPTAAALLLDLWNHYAIFINPGSSTAGLGMIFIPLWNLLIVIPLMAFLAHKLVRRRS